MAVRFCGRIFFYSFDCSSNYLFECFKKNNIVFIYFWLLFRCYEIYKLSLLSSISSKWIRWRTRLIIPITSDYRNLRIKVSLWNINFPYIFLHDTISDTRTQMQELMSMYGQTWARASGCYQSIPFTCCKYTIASVFWHHWIQFTIEMFQKINFFIGNCYLFPEVTQYTCSIN